jgi:cadmium resistance protein CadD (predicted permease)
MAELAAAVGVAAALFATTNIDDLVVLVAFFADRRFPPRQVVAGQFLGIAALVGLSLLLAVAALALPPPWVGLLGVVPILLGVRKLLQRRTGGEDAEDAAIVPRRRRSNVLAVAAVTVANGGDNLGVYTPVFAVLAPGEVLVTVMVFAAMTGAWCAAGYALVANPLVGGHIRRLGHALLPFVLIIIGVLVLLHADSLSLLMP